MVKTTSFKKNGEGYKCVSTINHGGLHHFHKIKNKKDNKRKKTNQGTTILSLLPFFFFFFSFLSIANQVPSPPPLSGPNWSQTKMVYLPSSKNFSLCLSSPLSWTKLQSQKKTFCPLFFFQSRKWPALILPSAWLYIAETWSVSLGQ